MHHKIVHIIMKGAFMEKWYQSNPYPVRIPVDLKEYLKEQASLAHRSYHAEIIYRLEQSRKREEQVNEG